MDAIDDDSSLDANDDSKANVVLKPASIARIVELARENCTAKEWGKWLSVPLEHAATEGDHELAKELVLAGARGDPISAAMRKGERKFVDRLLQLDHGPATKLRDHHLHLAVDLEDISFVALFLSRGLKPQKDYLLRFAASLGNEAIVSLLLKHGADPDDSPEVLVAEEGYLTPVLIAAKEGHAGVLVLLLDAGARAGRRLSTYQRVDADDVSCPDRRCIETESALDYAAIGGHVDVINAIVQRDPSLVNSSAEGTEKTALIYAANHQQVGAIDALVEARADLEARDTKGRSPLHVAAGSPECEPTLRVLLKHGANVDALDQNSLTPLCLAVGRGDQSAVDILVSAGADVNKSLRSVSRMSCEYNIVMIRTLLRYGADVNTQGVLDGNSPLHLAAMEGAVENVEVLLAAGGDENALNRNRNTPAEVAGAEAGILTEMFGDVERVEHLLRHAARDRSWTLRTLFVLCRKFPARLGLQLRTSEAKIDENDSPLSTARNRPVTTSHPNKKSPKLNVVGNRDQPESAATAARGAAKSEGDFVAAMKQLLGLEVDAVFSAIIGFV